MTFKTKKTLSLLLALLLLTPPIIGVVSFILFIALGLSGALQNSFLEEMWLGTSRYAGRDGWAGPTAVSAFTSSIPIFLGLMAIAGVYALSQNSQKNI